MSNKKFKGYTVVGTDIIKNEEVFYAIDSHSGGYPYWSSFIKDTTKNIREALAWLNEATSTKSYMSRDVTDVVIVKVFETYEVVPTAELQHELYEAAMAKLDENDKKVLGLL